MAHKFAEIAFTPTVRDIQAREGSRAAYASMDGDDYNHRLGPRESGFIGLRDSFYMASVSESGWPYVEHRGGPAGFMKVLNERTIGFADYSGNRQYLSTGNFKTDDRVALFFMDYPNRRRLKMLGRVRTVGLDEPELLADLEDADYPAQIERGFIIEVAGLDWNCPQHITPRFTELEIQEQLDALRAENRRLKDRLIGAADMTPTSGALTEPQELKILGEGPLELVVSGVRQLTLRVLSFELRDPTGRELPAVEPGSHLRVPVRLSSGELVDCHYSIVSSATPWATGWTNTSGPIKRLINQACVIAPNSQGDLIMKNIRLYRHPLSGHSHRVQLLLSLLGIEAELVGVDLAAGEHKQAEFLSRNRFGQVPVLEDGDQLISDSNAILVYLAEKYDNSDTWLPADPLAAAEVQRFLSIAAGQVAHGPAAARLVNVFGAALDQKRAIETAHSLLGVLESHLDDRQWLVGVNPTIADVANYTYIAHAPEGDVTLDRYPGVLAWLRRVEALPGFVPMQATLVGLAA